MTSELQTAQDIPIELCPFAISPYGDRFVVKNLQSKTFVFVDDEARFLLDCLASPSSMAVLIQQYHKKFGKYSYRKIFEFIALLMSASFLTQKCQDSLAAIDLFKTFSPPDPPRMIMPLSVPVPAAVGRPLSNLMDSRIAIGILAILTCYCAVHLFSRQDEFEWLMVGGQFGLGLAVWIVVLVADYFLKNVFKSALLSAKGLDTSGSGIRFVWGLPRYTVKDADILSMGPDATMRFHLTVVLFPAVFSFLGIILFERTGNGIFGIWSYTGLLVIFLQLSPFFRGEFLNAVDRLSGKNRMFETMKHFVDRKFVGRIFAAGQTFKLEARLIAYGMYLYSLLWLYVGHLMAKEALERNIHALTTTAMTGSAIQRLAAVMFVGGIFIPFFGVVAGVIRLICVNIYSIFEKPLNDVFHRVTHVIHRFRGLPKSEIADFLKDIPLFAHMTDGTRAKLSEYMQIEYFAAGHTILWQGQPGDAFYTIYQGQADVFRERSKGDRLLLATLTDHDSFGEIALIKDEPRTATVKARTQMICFTLRKQFFKEFVETCLEDKGQITKLIQWNALMKKMPMFADLPAEAIARVILEMSERDAGIGETVIREGDPAAEFYILRSGSAAVWKDYAKPAARQVATLNAGSYFGEIALFEDSPRTATVIADQPSNILVMSRNSFFNILRTSVLSGIWVEETSRVRMKELAAQS